MTKALVMTASTPMPSSMPCQMPAQQDKRARSEHSAPGSITRRVSKQNDRAAHTHTTRCEEELKSIEVVGVKARETASLRESGRVEGHQLTYVGGAGRHGSPPLSDEFVGV